MHSGQARSRRGRILGLLFFVAGLPSLAIAQSGHSDGVPPTDAAGRVLNLGFEEGTLRDWTASGDAFNGQPIEGDTVSRRRTDMKSAHAGRYWVGGFERSGDTPRGSLVSAPFRVTHPWASFLIAGGEGERTRAEILRAGTGSVIAQVSGDTTETLKPVAIDLTKQLGNEIQIRLVDDHPGGWGHVNFDDFRFHESKPAIPVRQSAMVPDQYTHAGLDPEAAAKAMTVPPGFKVTLFAGEPDVIQPIAMTIDERGRVWVAEAYSYPRHVPPEEAKDRILIFEDKDNDGKFDSRKVFAEKLNLVSGLEVGFGGAWVGAAPHLLFIPDKNGDDVPDGPPEILLDGWAFQDTHETLNSFIWGPDGWLYGCHGVFTHSRVGKPGTPSRERTPINAGIWRYHPTKHQFELFAEGTSNPWGVDFTETGQCIIEACVIPHLFHMVMGGRFERQAGQHFNPYTYDDIKTIADHRHYVGANPHAGNDKSDSMGGGHAHSGLLVYRGGSWPEEFRGSVFMNNIHGARLNQDVLVPKGSGFVGGHRPDFLLANDRWSQVVYLRAGPDGNVYMIDWYDKNQCHRNEVEMHDRTNGRIFKIAYVQADSTSFARARTLPTLDEAGLAAAVSDADSFVSRTARRLLQERASSSGAKLATATREALVPIATRGQRPAQRLGGLWALHVAGGLREEEIAQGLQNEFEHVRAWTIQLACEDKNPSGASLAKLAEMAKSDPSPVVRLFLASTLQRLPLEARWPIALGLIAHGEDATDHNLPLMYWYAVEPLAAADPSRAGRLAIESKIGLLTRFMARRLASMKTSEALATVADLIREAPDLPTKRLLLTGLSQGLEGERSAPMPRAWPDVAKALANDAESRVHVTNLSAIFGDATAMAALRATLADARADLGARREALSTLLRARDAGLSQTLVELLGDPALRGQALRGLAAFDDTAIPTAIVRGYPQYSPGEKRDALNTLVTRPVFALALLDAVEAKRIAASDLTADLIRNLRNLKHEKLEERLRAVWGTVRDTPAERAGLIDKYTSIIRRGYSDAPDPMLGRAIFAKTCQQCHVLFGVGAKTGPDLTGSNRADLEYILTNLVDPSALVGKDYQAHVIATEDGRVLTGIVQREDPNTLTLVTANETLTLPKGDVSERKLTPDSLMPEDQLKDLSDHEIRSLVAYLTGPAQAPLLATRENAATFWNGKDLTGWIGDASLWSVEDGEIVGKAPRGLLRNEFLRSEMAAGDFTLSLEVKLVKNEGNSGIQFRSEPHGDGEMKGYQADIGAGWWGKLYEENGRALLWDKSGEPFVKLGEWNTYKIICKDSRIRTEINGKTCVDLDDPPGARRGVFALQLHSGGPTEVRFRNMCLEIPERATVATIKKP